jgi:hypothetical protein
MLPSAWQPAYEQSYVASPNRPASQAEQAPNPTEQSKTFVAGFYGKTVGSQSCRVVVSSVNQLGCESSELAPDIAPTSELKQEHAQPERQQDEIDKLTSELHELRGEIAGR